ADQLKPCACAVGELVTVLLQQPDDLCSHRTGPQKGDSKIAVLDHCFPFCGVSWSAAPLFGPPTSVSGSCSPASRARRSASVSPLTITRETPSRTATTAGRAR